MELHQTVELRRTVFECRFSSDLLSAIDFRVERAQTIKFVTAIGSISFFQFANFFEFELNQIQEKQPSQHDYRCNHEAAPPIRIKHIPLRNSGIKPVLITIKATKISPEQIMIFLNLAFICFCT
jgi:hypothetical protein